ncbi:DUF2336 domain-containing protein [Niveispirillum irakense]|uniref:DUF2336 domain-containing protein n=1 Tax=Niveispirillum irakense TaxID=34011 RepID=UPI000405522D|nr:DUF2336 domain-containing protein [Niveispirillum irakense]
MSDMLTQQDVQRLLTDPSPNTRAEMAEKVAAQFSATAITASERALAEDIVRLMARDVATRVRVALADSLKRNASIPHDVALSLARDVEEVALPFIEVSTVLTDSDLVEIVRSGSSEKQTAVARRPEVSAHVAGELVERGSEKVVATLMANDTAEIDEQVFSRALDRFPDSKDVAEPMVGRSRLPATVAERLVALVSEQLRERLVAKHDLSANLAADVVLQSRERATYGLVGGMGDAELERLVAQLRRSNRLTPSLLLRALCMGDVPFLEMAMAQLGQVPVSNARLLIHDAGRLGLKSLFDRTGLPPKLYPALRIAMDVANETEFDGLDHDLERHRRRMLERILTQFEELASEDVDYLLTKLSDLRVAAA